MISICMVGIFDSTDKKSFSLWFIYCLVIDINTALSCLLKLVFGKGAADGVAAIVKTLADKLLSYGKDLWNANELYEKV